MKIAHVEVITRISPSLLAGLPVKNTTRGDISLSTTASSKTVLSWENIFICVPAEAAYQTQASENQKCWWGGIKSQREWQNHTDHAAYCSFNVLVIAVINKIPWPLVFTVMSQITASISVQALLLYWGHFFRSHFLRWHTCVNPPATHTNCHIFINRFIKEMLSLFSGCQFISHP